MKREQTQAEKFKEAARELDVDLDEGRLKQTLRKIAPEKKGQEKKDDG